MSDAALTIVFDIGGVLVRVLPWDAAHFASGYPEAQLPPLDAFLPVLSELNHAYDRGEMSPSQYEAGVVEASQCRYSVGDVRRIHAATLQGEFAGVSSVIQALEQANVTFGLLSNTNPVHWARLLGHGQHGRDEKAEYPSLLRASYRLASFMLLCEKPDPRIYRAFTSATGAQPAEILFFDDREPNVYAAIAAGWHAEHIDPAGDVASQLLDALNDHEVIMR